MGLIMNNEPVAYLMVERNNQTTHFQTSIPTREEKISHHAIPLYTKPEDTETTLTDDEIKWIAIKHQGTWDEDTFLCVDYKSFARAILRKAQEK